MSYGVTKRLPATPKGQMDILDQATKADLFEAAWALAALANDAGSADDIDSTRKRLIEEIMPIRISPTR